MKLLLTIFGLFTFMASHCQEDIFFQRKDADNGALKLYGNTALQNTALDGEILTKIVRGGFIDTELKETNLKNSNDVNILGAELRYGLDLAIFNGQLDDSKTWGYQFVYENVYLAEATFRKDLLRLALYGNQPLIGDSLEMSGTKFKAINYQKIGFGFKNSRTQSYINLSFVNGFSIQSAYLDRFGMKTENYSNIDISYKGHALSNNSGGNGIALNAEWNIDVSESKNLSRLIQFNLQDLGYIHWDSSTEHIDADTSFNYTGVVISSLSSITDEFNNLDVRDSLIQNEYSARTTEVLLPFVSLAYREKINEKSDYLIQVKHRFNSNYITSFSATYIRAVSSFFDCYVAAQIGGYQHWNVKLGAQLKSKNNWFLLVSTQNIEMLAPSISSGGSINFSITKQW